MLSLDALDGVKNLEELDKYFAGLYVKGELEGRLVFCIKNSNYQIANSKIIFRIKEVINKTNEMNSTNKKEQFSNLIKLLDRRFVGIKHNPAYDSFCQQLWNAFNVKEQMISKSRGKWPTLQALPSEIFINLLSFLGKVEKQKVITTSHSLMEISKRQEFLQIKLFIEFLAKNIELFNKSLSDEQKKKLSEVNSIIIEFNSENLLSTAFLLNIKSATNLREDITNTLKHFDDNTLRTLEKLSTAEGDSNFFNVIFELVEIYKKIDVAQAIIDLDERRHAFKNIFEALIQKDSIEKAVKVAMSALSISKDFHIQDLTEVLVKSGHIDEALEVAKIITNPVFRGQAIRGISQVMLHRVLTENNNNIEALIKGIDKVVTAINTIVCSEEALEDTYRALITRAMVENCNNEKAFETFIKIIDKSIQVSSLMTSINERILALKEISKALIKKAIAESCNDNKSIEVFIKMVDKVVQIANLMPSEEERTEVLYYICCRKLSYKVKDLKDSNESVKAFRAIRSKVLDLANMISDEQKRDQVIEFLPGS